MSAPPATFPTLPSGRLARLRRLLARTAVCLIVAGHLLYFAVRNPLVVQGGDVLLRVLLFWAMFLPWCAYYSVDSLSRPTPPRRCGR